MDDNNSFINAYKKKAREVTQSGREEAPAAEAPSDTMQYQMESGFVKPDIPIPSASQSGNRVKRAAAYAAAGGILLLIILGIVWFLNRGIELINFVNWTENDAQLWARNHGVLLQVDNEYNDTYEAGKVFAQFTAPGTRVKRGSFVRLSVSLGHDLSVTLPRPDILSMTKDEIDQWAAENFMTRVRITVDYSDTVPVGQVIRFEVNDNTVINEVRRDSPIYIILSRGPEEAKEVPVTLPNFKDMALAQCYAFANEHGLVLKVEEAHDDLVPAGNIISQSIRAEEKVPQGTEVVLVISKGKMILVPNVSGYTRERAVAAVSGLGITVMINERYSSAKAGAFLSQSIPAGSVYTSGDILELTYSIDNQISLASFVGSTRDAIERWASDLNAQGARLSINVTSTSSNAPRGTIIFQDIANRSIGINTTIRITVSTGRVIFVPDLVAPAGSDYDTAITREKAMAICEANGLIPIFVAEARSGRLPGEIWSQSLAAGTETNEGTTITLKFVPSSVQVTVPDFTGMTQAEIRDAGYHKMFTIQYVIGEAMEGRSNQVIGQSLRILSKAASGSAITLTIAPAQPGDEAEG